MKRPISAEHSIAWIGAGTRGRRTLYRDQAERIALDLDWDRLKEALQSRRLLVTLGPRITALTSSPDPKFVKAVDDAIEIARRRNNFLRLVSDRILARLAAAGVRAAPLKGPTLDTSLYGDPGRRSSNDIDLLVDPEQLRTAVSILLELGYGAPKDSLSGDGLPLLHLSLMHEQGTLPPVELHWRIHWYERDFSIDRLLPPNPVALDTWQPERIDDLASLLLFYARDGFVGLRLATDLSAWWDKYGAEVEPGELDGIIAAYPGLARVVPAAAEVAGRMVGVPLTLPDGAAEKLDRRQRTAVRLANSDPRPDPAEIYATAGLIDGLLAPRGGIPAFVRRQIVPSREVLEQQAEHGARNRRRSRLSRAAGILGRYALVLVKAAARRPRPDRDGASGDR